MKRIKSIEELINAIKSGNNNFFIGNGLIRSSKYIEYNDYVFYVFNEIDNSEQTLNSEELFDENCTNIGVSIKNGTFYAY